MKLSTITLATFAALSLQTAAATTAVVDSDLTPTYAVGVVTNFVRDFNQPFDAWGRKYKSTDYQVLLDRLEEAQVPHTTYTNIYYPAKLGKGLSGARAETTIPASLPAAISGTRLTLPELLGGDIIAELGSPLKPSQSGAIDKAEEWSHNPHQAYVNAPQAEGKFPLVIMVHGLTGSVQTWNTAAEYLTSQGYIVVTVSLTSDSAHSAFLSDPSSPLAGKLTDKQIKDIYVLRSLNTGTTVFDNFFIKMFGYDKPVKGIPDLTGYKASREGALRSNQMMSDMFEQRTADIGKVISEMQYLNESKESCQAALEHGAFTKPLCGVFTDKIDVAKIGVMGHSLGSMTAQAAGAFYEEVDSVIGFNNGLPRAWEPWGGLPGDPSSDNPTGVTKPFLQLIGSDDAFVHNVFRNIHVKMFEDAGGDPSINYPLPAERLWPTPENPQPVARSAYERATAEKMIVTLRAQSHMSQTDELESYFIPNAKVEGMPYPMGRKIPFSKDAPMESMEALGWIQEDGKDIYLPHLMRNYFIANWFNWTLKDDEKAREHLINQPYSTGVQQMLHDGVSN